MSAPRSRPPAVAGLFYPAETQALRHMLTELLAANPASGPEPKALIAPHAGYLYSGPVAARAYNLLKPAAARIRRVVLLGPAHRVALRGLALPSVDCFRTPLGDIQLDRQAMAQMESLPQVTHSDSAHELEHSLEVHLPFLQTLLPDFALIPLVVGWAQPGEVAAVLELLWGGRDTLIIISSDLSHYHPYETARQLDTDTARRIEAREFPIPEEQACGAYPLNGLLSVAQSRDLHISRLDLCNSGDTAGDHQRVVGYGAWVLYDA